MPERWASVPLAAVRRVQIYINSPRRTLAQIKRATGADYLINGTLYNMTTGAVNCHLKADGRVIARPSYTVYGLGWDAGRDIRMEVLPNDRRNYIACTPLILEGKPLAKLTYASGQGGSRARSAIGIMGEKLVMYCTTSGRTPEKLRDELAKAGWTQAVMLDGGGSAQCDFAGQKITSSRKVQHLILVYTEKEYEAGEPKGAKPMVEINAYSRAKDGAKKLSTNFTVKEFACSDGSDAVLVAPRLVMVLQSIRSRFGQPVTINSAYRTPQKNAAVGGAAQSQHCYGTAADIVVKGVAPAKVAACARELMPDWGGVGIYARQGFTHVDVRETRADWTGA
nr:D-Ala-D-Ala carboxypeptidase family metallohydrolase [uncultured Oscillibacter sp.]